VSYPSHDHNFESGLSGCYFEDCTARALTYVLTCKNKRRSWEVVNMCTLIEFFSRTPPQLRFPREKIDSGLNPIIRSYPWSTEKMNIKTLFRVKKDLGHLLNLIAPNSTSMLISTLLFDALLISTNPRPDYTTSKINGSSILLKHTYFGRKRDI
jgi:hypothetical protein